MAILPQCFSDVNPQTIPIVHFALKMYSCSILKYFYCQKHIYPNFIHFYSHLKMTSERSKHRDFLSLVFVAKQKIIVACINGYKWLPSKTLLRSVETCILFFVISVDYRTCHQRVHVAIQSFHFDLTKTLNCKHKN